MFKKSAFALAMCASVILTGCGSDDDEVVAAPVVTAAPNVIFFLGDGMGMTSLTAARIYKVGEDGELTIDTLPETAFIKTYSLDAQVTDSAPSMAAYMTGVKMNNEVISMSSDTKARASNGVDYVNGSDSTCPDSGNGKPVQSLLELFKAKNHPVGVVTTTRVTHATPATTYAHICHRDGENNIAAQFVPNSATYNSALGDGVDVLLGGGRKHFLAKADGGARADSRNLVNELKAQGYSYASNQAEFAAIDATKTKKLVGLFTSSHMSYDLDRDPTKEPSLAEMTSKAIDVLKTKADNKGFFLMVEGGRIDHALHETTAKKALQDTAAFDDAIKVAIDKMKLIDPELKNTLIVVTADHDHTLVLNGYAKRTGKTTATNAGVLGLVKNYVTGDNWLDVDGMPFSIIGFGNGESRPQYRSFLTDAMVSANDYHQEAAIQVGAGSETHGGTDVFLGAMGKGAENFTGSMENIEVYSAVRKATGL
jgi:alkaline phosphatase